MRTPQAPINSGFTAASTTAQVIEGIDLTGKIAIVTGGYAGLGLETTRTLASAGATVIVPARDMAKAKAAVAAIERVEVEPMDLIDPASIDSFAANFIVSGRPLHILVNSAGVMCLPRLARDSRGFEHHFAINHLGHFHLTVRLWEALRKAQGARVVSVSAWAHRFSPVVFDDLNFQHREYQPMLGYAQSKTANILFAAALDAHGKADGIRAFSLHPGSIVATELNRHFSREELRAFAVGIFDEDGNPILDPLKQLKTVEQGAATQVWCAVSPKLDGLGGIYCENVEVAGIVPPEQRAGWNLDAATSQVGVMPHAIDPNTADRLWRVSTDLLDLPVWRQVSGPPNGTAD